MKYNISPNKIIILQPNEIFGFGSNLSGFHGAGAAKLAFDEFFIYDEFGNDITELTLEEYEVLINSKQK